MLQDANTRAKGVRGAADMLNRPMALDIERMTAADANEPLVDDYVYLAGRPPLRDYIHFMTEWARYGKMADVRALTNEWRAASGRLSELVKHEAGWGDNPVAGQVGHHPGP